MLASDPHQLFMKPYSSVQVTTQEKVCKKLTHSMPDETETAESKRSEPKGPTFAFSTRNPCLARSSLLGPFCPSKPTAYEIVEMQ